MGGFELSQRFGVARLERLGELVDELRASLVGLFQECLVDPSLGLIGVGDADAKRQKTQIFIGQKQDDLSPPQDRDGHWTMILANRVAIAIGGAWRSDDLPRGDPVPGPGRIGTTAAAGRPGRVLWARPGHHHPMTNGDAVG